MTERDVLSEFNELARGRASTDELQTWWDSLSEPDKVAMHEHLRGQIAIVQKALVVLSPALERTEQAFTEFSNAIFRIWEEVKASGVMEILEKYTK